MEIIADDGGVDVAELVELRRTEETDRDAPALQPVAEHFWHRDGGDRGFAQFAVADRQRQHVGRGADRAALVDQRDVRRMRQPRTLQAADGAPMPTKQTSSLLSARLAAMVIISLGVKPNGFLIVAHAAFLRCSTRAAKSSALFSITFACIHAWNFSGRRRSRPIPDRRHCHAHNSRARRMGAIRLARPIIAAIVQRGSTVRFGCRSSKLSTTSSTVTTARLAASTASPSGCR